MPSYYYRQNVEQTLDFYKNNTAVLPLRVHNDRTLKGHLLISFIALCIVKFLQVYLGTTDDIFGSKLKYLRNQKCLVIGGHVLIEPAQKYLNDIYKKLCIEVPTTIDIEKNGLAQLYSGSNEEDLDFLNKALRKKQSKINPTNNTTNDQTSVTKGDTEQSRSTKDVSIISENDAQATTSDSASVIESTVSETTAVKRGRGRPKGSKNKAKVAVQTATSDAPSTSEVTTVETVSAVKRGRGRPKGSKNKSKKVDQTATSDANDCCFGQ